VPEPWQVMGAWVDGRMVGVTAALVQNRATCTMGIMITGVDADQRGRGIAGALKRTHAITLRDRGWRRIQTLNLEGNDAILATNRSAGFRPAERRQDWTYDVAAGDVAIQ
jgi:GNAT superfamily N-acetyltransferase